MINTSNQVTTEKSTSPSPVTEVEQKFNLNKCWYPVIFVQDLPKNRPYGFTIYDQSFVLFRNQSGKWICLKDLCPHRAAKLSDGQIIDGKIECLYHGWQFDSNGKCSHIPQLPKDATIPINSCIQSFTVIEKQGMIWFWWGNELDIDENLIPLLPDIDKPGFVRADFMLDLPYDQSYLVENVMDPAHVSISHHNTRGGGNRKNAQPLDMEVIETSPQGIRGRWRGQNKTNDSWKLIDFIAPSLVLNSAYIQDKNWTFGLALYCVPSGKNRCRLLARGYRNFLNWGVKIRPRWLDHLNTNKILEQDLPLIFGQQEQIEKLAKNLQEVYLPLKTSDLLVVEYRKWLDKYGHDLPFYQGYTTSKESIIPEVKQKFASLDRFNRHTQICSSCSQAYQRIIRVKQTLIGFAITLGALATITDVYKIKIILVFFSMLSVLMAVFAQKLKTKFEQSYTRN